jgi:hypothetical protein
MAKRTVNTRKAIYRHNVTMGAMPRGSVHHIVYILYIEQLLETYATY